MSVVTNTGFQTALTIIYENLRNFIDVNSVASQAVFVEASTVTVEYNTMKAYPLTAFKTFKAVPSGANKDVQVVAASQYDIKRSGLITLIDGNKNLLAIGVLVSIVGSNANVLFSKYVRETTGGGTGDINAADYVSAQYGNVLTVDGEGKFYVPTQGGGSGGGYEPDGTYIVLAGGKLSLPNIVTPGTKSKVTYNAKGLVTGGDDLSEDDIPALPIDKITGLVEKLEELTGGGTPVDSEVIHNLQLQINEAMNQLVGKLTGNDPINPGTYTKMTVDSNGLVTFGTVLDSSDLPILGVDHIEGLRDLLGSISIDGTLDLDQLLTIVGAKADRTDIDLLRSAVELKIDTSLVNQLLLAKADKLELSQLSSAIETVRSSVNNKVDKVIGKGLSTNDFTDADKAKLTALTVGGGGGTTDLTDVYNQLANKVDKVAGKVLSSNDYTNAEKNKLASVEDMANRYVLPPATASSSGGVTVPSANGLSVLSGLLQLALASVSANGAMSKEDKQAIIGFESRIKAIEEVIGDWGGGSGDGEILKALEEFFRDRWLLPVDGGGLTLEKILDIINALSFIPKPESPLYHTDVDYLSEVRAIKNKEYGFQVQEHEVIQLVAGALPRPTGKSKLVGNQYHIPVSLEDEVAITLIEA